MAVKGTLEYYRHIYLTEGLHAMINSIEEVLTEAGREPTPERLSKWVKAVMYGPGKDGIVRGKPIPPNPQDMLDNPEKHEFEKQIYKKYVNQAQNHVLRMDEVHV